MRTNAKNRPVYRSVEDTHSARNISICVYLVVYLLDGETLGMRKQKVIKGKFKPMHFVSITNKLGFRRLGIAV